MMNIPINETIVMDIAGACARVLCEDPTGRASLVALGFYWENDKWVRPIADDQDRINIINALIDLKALFSCGRDWSPSELVDYYHERGAVPNGYRMITWTSPDKYLIIDR